MIVYCASGGRSALAGQVLKEMGYGETAHPWRVQGLGGQWRGDRQGRDLTGGPACRRRWFCS